MPGRSPQDAVAAFLEPLAEALSCIARGKLELSKGGRGEVGKTHSWSLNGGDGAPVGDGFTFNAGMHYEILDRGQSRGSQRFKVSTRGYVYSLERPEGREMIGMHWHPNGTSPFRDPHLHLCSDAVSEAGGFLARTHIPTQRMSFEWMVRWVIEDVPKVQPLREDYDERLSRTEALFDQHKSW